MFVGGVATPMIGMAALAYFDGCDPVKSGKLQKYDQIVVYLAMKIFHESPGLVLSVNFSGDL